eukprot:1159016-Pelagomonas_calceolata.AAC.11
MQKKAGMSRDCCKDAAAQGCKDSSTHPRRAPSTITTAEAQSVQGTARPFSSSPRAFRKVSVRGCAP